MGSDPGRMLFIAITGITPEQLQELKEEKASAEKDLLIKSLNIL